MRNESKVGITRDASAAILELRDRIDAIDAEILQLLGSRARTIVKIGALKSKTGMKVKDSGREMEVFERWSELSVKYGLPSDMTRKLLSTILYYSRRQQTKLRKRR